MKKTVIVTISSPSVYRNLFLFPGCLFDLLKEKMSVDPELELVLVTASSNITKYEHLLGSDKSLVARIHLEAVDVSNKKSFLQKLFYFTYSYLVYTGTTKIMATMGTRPDEPPAGGKTYLAPLKVLISLIFGRFLYLKQVVVPSLFGAVFKENPFERLFEKYSPVTAFAAHIYSFYDTVFLAAAKKHGIKAVAMPSGWDHLDKYFLPIHADKIIVPSNQVKAMARDLQKYPEENIVVTGYPHFDFIAGKSFVRPREQTLDDLNFPQDTKYIVYASGSSYCPDEPEIIETILYWADNVFPEHNLHVVIRPYAGGRSSDRDFDHKKFDKFADHPRVKFYGGQFWNELDKSSEFLNILYHSNGLVSVYSTMVLEAAAIDVPIMTAAFDGYHKRPYYRSIRRFEEFDHFKDVIKTGALSTTYNFDELYAAIEKYLRNKTEMASAREVLKERLCYKLDGKASSRILEVLLG